jgi:hypothetical protein
MLSILMMQTLTAGALSVHTEITLAREQVLSR